MYRAVGTAQVAQRRLRNAQLRCGIRKTALSRYGDKGKEVVFSAIGLA